jgi:hypothetical protein
VIGWGLDNYGQALPPASVDGTSGTASAIAAGFRHSCAIQAGTGNVVCWGDNDYNQASPPASVDGTSGTASAIAAGGRHNLAIQGVPAIPVPAISPVGRIALTALMLGLGLAGMRVRSVPKSPAEGTSGELS